MSLPRADGWNEVSFLSRLAQTAQILSVFVTIPRAFAGKGSPRLLEILGWLFPFLAKLRSLG